jgi:hypothetical protein
MGRTGKPKKKIEKITGSPQQKLQELEESAQLTQFRIELKRRWPDGSVQTCRTYHQMPPDMITSMPDWVPQEFGGGNFEAYVTHPMDSGDNLFVWGFTIEGDPIIPKRQPKPDPNNPFGAQGVARPPWQQPGMPPVQPWGPQYQQPGISGYPHPYGQPNPWAQQRPVRDTRLEGQLEDLKRQNADLQRQMAEQRHQEEMRRIREDSAKQFNALKSGMDQQIQVLKTEITKSRKKDDGGDNKLFDMFMQSSQRQQDMMQMMMTRESDASREQVKAMKEQMLADIEFRKDMYDKINDSKDPKHAAAMLDIMGQQTASTMNLLQQAVTSGLLGGQDGDPPWYRAVSQGLEKLNEFGNNLLAAKQREAAMQGMAGLPQPARPRFPAPRPGFNQAPAGQPGPPRPPLTPPAPPGATPGPTPGPQPPPGHVPGQSDMPPTQGVIEQDEGEEVQQPPSLVIPIQRFVMAMQQDFQDPNHEHTRVVADMIYDFAIFMKNNEMMPPEWRGIFDDPAATIGEFLNTFVMPVNPEMANVSEEYLAELGQHIQDIMKEESEDEEEEEEEAEEEQKPPLQPVPTPPVPPEEKEPEENDEQEK